MTATRNDISLRIVVIGEPATPIEKTREESTSRRAILWIEMAVDEGLI
jgi:hypothetical protein